MKNLKSRGIVIAVILLGLLSSWLWRKNVAVPVWLSAKSSSIKTPPANTTGNAPATAIASASGSASPSFNQSALNPATGQPEVKVPQNLPDTTKLQMILDAQNSQEINFYGKVVDQYGQSVAGAQVRGNIMVYASAEASGSRNYYTQTDAAGNFKFVGLHAAKFGAAPSKDGYEYNERQPNNWSETYKPDPANPMVFTMYKLQGAEPMVHTQLDSRVPYDGTAATFDLLTGKKGDTGDLRITLLRTPQQIKRGTDHFEWNVSIEIIGGGLVGSSDLYPYEAPENGYQGTFEFSQAKAAPNWTQRLAKTFYIHTAKGDYGRVTIDLTVDSERPDTGVSVESYLNPSGSRNLEYDRKNEAKPSSP